MNISRVRWGSLDRENVYFNLPVNVSFGWGQLFGHQIYYTDTLLHDRTHQISINLPGILQSHGEISVSAKAGPHVITQNETMPPPSTYINTSNTEGKVTIKWKDGKAPDTSTVGRINSEIVVEDETGRTASVSVPIDVSPAPL